MMTEDRKQKLQELQQKLEDCGVKDIKFFFDPTSKKDVNKLADSVIPVLEAYLNGECTPALKFNDSYRDRTLP